MTASAPASMSRRASSLCRALGSNSFSQPQCKNGKTTSAPAARAREMLARSNPRVIRSAILSSPDQSLANLQVVRLIREAESTSRRHFISADEQYLWLAEVLTDPERARLAEFLSISQGVRLSEQARGSEPTGLETSEPRSAELRRADPGASGGERA